LWSGGILTTGSAPAGQDDRGWDLSDYQAGCIRRQWLKGDVFPRVGSIPAGGLSGLADIQP